ncbi:lauroyl acyltransferase [uncultured Roseovarius sp.]|uniref:lysophospholipid acyltransferase family protein n=1 Tax=uncultured Roseovarius sp. TaxID=293344 RepID=UPI0026373654|nr:lauroyl acyltransferase [uncultured Roseovarius sp.]
MAKFILGNTFRDKALDNAVARNTLWFLDLIFVGAVMGLFRVLPVRWSSAFGARLGRIFGKIAKQRNRHVRANLTLALPDRSPEDVNRLAGEVWANAGAVLAEYPNLKRIGDPRGDRIEIEILEQIPAYSEPDQPAVFVSAHMANWEVIALAITRLGLPSCAMYAPLSNPWLDRIMLNYREALGCDLVSREDGLRAFMDALKAGRSPTMITDRRIEGGKPIPFFGEDKASSILPARLALRFGVPLVPVQAERLPGARFRVRFHAPLVPSDLSADRDGQAVDLAHQINDKFEDWIKARPGEWLCTSKIWPSSVLRAKTDIYIQPRRAAE